MTQQYSEDDVLSRLRHDLRPETVELIRPEVLNELFRLLVSEGRQEEFGQIAEFMDRAYKALSAQDQEFGKDLTLESLERAASAIPDRARKRRKARAAPSESNEVVAADSRDSSQVLPSDPPNRVELGG